MTTTTKTKPRKHAKPSKKAGKVSAGITGTYVYDAKTDRVVKVSDRIPSVASRRSSGGSSSESPCGEGSCGSGPCGDMGGGCGGGACGL